jgi:hypothetical protein
MTDESNRAQAEFWDEIAPAWTAAEQHTELVAARFGDLAADHLVTSLLISAGFADVQVTPHSDVVALPESQVESQVESIVELSRSVGPVREALRDADEDLTTAIVAGVRDALAAKVTNGELRLTAAANIVSARA